MEPHKVLKFPLEEQMKYHDGLIKYWHDVSGEGDRRSALPVDPKPDALNFQDGNWKEI